MWKRVIDKYEYFGGYFASQLEDTDSMPFYQFMCMLLTVPASSNLKGTISRSVTITVL